jgi:hypothetical protein
MPHMMGPQCPSCHVRIAPSHNIFSESFRCPQCDTRLQVSSRYGRTLVVLSLAISFLIVWIVGVRSPVRFCLFYAATSFVVLSLVLIVAPHLVRPKLVTDEPSHVLTLGLWKRNKNIHDQR